jgi:hypothetical protein
MNPALKSDGLNVATIDAAQALGMRAINIARD